MPKPIPETIEECINMLVQLDVQRWGEAEREASRRLNTANYPTYGLALNALAHHAGNDHGVTAPELVNAAKAALTPADRAALRKG